MLMGVLGYSVLIGWFTLCLVGFIGYGYCVVCWLILVCWLLRWVWGYFDFD